jgi:hypothetical protein
LDDLARNMFDGCLKLAEYWATRYEGRRQFEWKVTLAWWGLIVLAVHYVHSGVLRSLPSCQYTILSVSFALILLFSFVGLWLYPLSRANARDKEKSFAAAYSAQGILLNSEAQPKLMTNEKVDVSVKTFTKDWAMRFQAFTTLLLLAVLCISVRY